MLSSPISSDIAILSALPKKGAALFLDALLHTGTSVRYPIFTAYLAMFIRYPHLRQAQKSFAILVLQVSRDMKSVAVAL